MSYPTWVLNVGFGPRTKTVLLRCATRAFKILVSFVRKTIYLFIFTTIIPCPSSRRNPFFFVVAVFTKRSYVTSRYAPS